MALNNLRSLADLWTSRRHKVPLAFSAKRGSVAITVLLVSLSFFASSVATLGGAPNVLAFSAPNNCGAPALQTGTHPTLNSTFTLTIIGGSGQTVTFNQNTILSLPTCSSFGGFVHGSPPFADAYANYTGVPLLTLVNLVGGVRPGGTVTVTSGTDDYQTTYTYSEVVDGTGWGSIYTTSSLTSPVTTSPPMQMYLVLAYLKNGSPLSAYTCTSSPPPCPSGPTSDGVGPLRTVTLSSSPGYLIARGAPWNKGATEVQVKNPPTPVPEFGLGIGSQAIGQAGMAIAVALGLLTLVAMRKKSPPPGR